MQVLRSASVLDFRGPILIHIMDTVTHIPTTDITGHITGITVHHTTGTTVTASIIGIIVTTIGRIKFSQRNFAAGGCNSRRLYFFGEVDAAGPEVDAAAGDGSANSFFKRS
jgi:hypothetical protein